MLQLLLAIVSYGSLLLLLMPPTGAGIISTAVVLVIGICLIVCGRAYIVAPWKNKQFYLIPVAIIIAVILGLNFYNRWLPSSKIQSIAAMLHMPVKILLLIGLTMLSGLAVWCIYAALQMIVRKLADTDPQADFTGSIGTGIFAAIVTVILAQTMIDMEALSMGYLNFAWGVLIVSTAILVMYCLLSRIIPAIAVGAGAFMVIATINVYVYRFRGRLFEPVDVFLLTRQ